MCEYQEVRNVLQKNPTQSTSGSTGGYFGQTLTSSVAQMTSRRTVFAVDINPLHSYAFSDLVQIQILCHRVDTNYLMAAEEGTV